MLSVAAASCLTIGSSDSLSSTGLSSAAATVGVLVIGDSAGASSFLLLPRGAGSKGVRQYVTVRVTTWRTLTFPGLPLISGSTSRGENEALHGAALSGVLVYGDGSVLAEPGAGENGD